MATTATTQESLECKAEDKGSQESKQPTDSQSDDTDVIDKVEYYRERLKMWQRIWDEKVANKH